MRPSTRLSLIGAVAALPLAGAAFAVPFDLIYVDRADFTLCSGCGMTKVAMGFALLVNPGPDPITQQDLETVKFTCTSSQPGIAMIPFLNFPGPPIAPVVPHEAMGSVLDYDPMYPEYSGNALFLDLVAPDETFRNTSELQVWAFHIDRDLGNTYEGPVTFDITMSMNGHVATFQIESELHMGGFGMNFPHAARVSAVPVSTPTRKSTWGQLKKRFQ